MPRLVPAIITTTAQRTPTSCNPLSPELPVEIWLLIAEYLEGEERVKLMALNRLFFELAMDQMYRKLSLVSNNIEFFVETMELLESPMVARRVRSLTIWPLSIYEAISNDKNDWERHNRITPSNWQPPPPKTKGILNKIKGALRPRPEVPDIAPPPVDHRHPPKKSLLTPSVLQRKALFAQALERMTMVEEVVIYIPRFADIDVLVDSLFLPEHLQQVLWPMVRRGVRHLTIDVPHTALGWLLPDAFRRAIPFDPFPNLRRLDLKVRNANSRGGSNQPEVEGTENFATGIAFIQAHSETLKTLEVYTVQAGFWDQLGVIPSLTSLIVQNMPTTPRAVDARQYDFHRFLLRNPSITNLTLKTDTRSPYPVHPSTNKCDTDTPMLPNLASLTLSGGSGDVAPFTSPQAHVAHEHLSYLGSSFTSVPDLEVKFPMRLSDIRVVLDSFSPALSRTVTRRSNPHLRGLHISVPTLCENVLRLLAERCPQLVKLHLTTEKFVPAASLTAASSSPADSNLPGFIAALRNQAQHLQSWTLEDLTIMQWVRGGCKYQWEAMNALAHLVPSIKSFAGRGHMREAGLAEMDPTYAIIDGIRRHSEAWA